MNKMIFLCLLVLSFSAQAYIPKFSTILTKMTANAGGTKGFILKRTLTLKDDNTTCNETWYVSHADAMKVDVDGVNPDGSKWAFEILYKGGKRITANVEGKSQSFPLSPEFFEPLLHYRNTKALNARLNALQMAPSWSSGEESSTTYITLDRYKGGVVYLMGAADSKNTLLPPRLWIEQDSFLIKKIRLGSQVEVEFDTFKDFDEGKIKQPEMQTIFWKNSTVLIQNTSTQLVEQSKIEPLLKIQKGNQVALPANTNLKEFYSRFR